MEYLNRITIRGIVGSVQTPEPGSRSARMTVMTQTAHYAGGLFIETQWHTVSAIEGKGIKDLGSVRKGDAVEITGHLRLIPCTAADGTRRCTPEIFASEFKNLNSEPLTP